MSYLMDFHRNVSFFTCICDELDFIRVSKGYTMSNRQQIKALYCAYTFIICNRSYVKSYNLEKLP